MIDSRALTNGRLSTTDTSLQRPLFFVPADSPYIDSCLNLSTTVTSVQRPLFFAPADSPYIDSCLNLSKTATSLQRQRPLKLVPNYQNNLSTTAVFFKDRQKKLRMAMKFDPYGALMTNHGIVV